MEKTGNFKERVGDIKNKAIEIKNKAVTFTKETVKKIQADKKKRIIATIIITAFILFLGLGTVMYYIAGPSEGYMTADSTDSLEWAEEYRITGELISEEYNYAAILPFGGNQIFLPFLAIFGYSMNAQIGGLLVFAILMCAALVYLGRGLGFGWFTSAGLSSVVMLLLSSSPKLREIMWEHIFYYNLGILFFCFGFGLLIRILRDADKINEDRKVFIKTAVRMCIFMMFCVLASTDGLQALMCLTLPLLASLVLYCVFKKETPIFSKDNKWHIILFGAIVVSTLVGVALLFAITNGVKAGYANSYSAYSSIHDVMNNLLRQVPNWFTLFGIDYLPGDSLVSKESIINLIKIATAIILFIVPIAQLIRYKKIENKPLKLVLLGHAALMAFLLFACVFGNIGTVNWRLTPLLGTSSIITVVSLFEYLKGKGIMKRMGVLLVACVMLGSFVSFKTVWDMPANYGEKNNWHMVAEELEKRDLKYGYATFWWANLTKMIAGNGVQIANIGIDGNGFIRQEHYQSRKDAYEDRETDRYFVIFNEADYRNARNWINHQKATGTFVEEIVVESGEYKHNFYQGSKSYIIVVNQNPF